MDLEVAVVGRNMPLQRVGRDVHSVLPNTCPHLFFTFFPVIPSGYQKKKVQNKAHGLCARLSPGPEFYPTLSPPFFFYIV